MKEFIQDGSDVDQLIYADWLEDQGLSELASDAREDILAPNEASEWFYEYRWGSEVGGVVGMAVGGKRGGVGGGTVGRVVGGGTVGREVGGWSGLGGRGVGGVGGGN